jgi:hypothetical protein
MHTKKLSAEELISGLEIRLYKQSTSSVYDVIISEMKNIDVSQLDKDQSIRIEKIKRQVGA